MHRLKENVKYPGVQKNYENKQQHVQHIHGTKGKILYNLVQTIS